MKKSLVALIIIIVISGFVFAANYGEHGIVQAELAPHFKIFMDGTEKTYKDVTGKTVTPIIVEGTTYLPLRGVCESVGKDVDWNEDTETITITTTSNSMNINNDTQYEIVTSAKEGADTTTPEIIMATIKATRDGITATKTFEMSALIDDTGTTTLGHYVGTVAYVSETGGEYYRTHFYAMIINNGVGDIIEVGSLEAPLAFPY